MENTTQANSIEGNISSSSSALSLRRIIETLLIGDDIDSFFLDYYPEIKRQCSSGMTRAAKINLLLERADHDEIIMYLRQNHPKDLFPYKNPIFKANNISPTTTISRTKQMVFSVIFILFILIFLAYFLINLISRKQYTQEKTVEDLAQSSYEYHGIIIEKLSGGPLIGAKIWILGTKCEDVTDEYGLFRFSGCDDENLLKLTQPMIKVKPKNCQTWIGPITLEPTSKRTAVVVDVPINSRETSRPYKFPMKRLPPSRSYTFPMRSPLSSRFAYED